MTRETSLEMCQRHVAEGKARIARQEQLIASLSRAQQIPMMQRAIDFLSELLQFQQVSVNHLASEEAKAEETARAPSDPRTTRRDAHAALSEIAEA